MLDFTVFRLIGEEFPEGIRLKALVLGNYPGGSRVKVDILHLWCSSLVGSFE